MAAAPAIYRAEGIEKRYGGVVALAGVDLEIRPGEIHALVGANGAGKSTLMKILAGVERPSAGRLTLAGTPVEFASAREAADIGVVIVSQELSLFPHLSVLANLFILREPRRFGLVDRTRMRALAEPVAAAIALDASLDSRVGDLRLGERQLVEIGRALLGEPRVLILDEPTSALLAAESDRLHRVIRRLRDTGVGIVYVSHVLEDVVAIADAITVVRDGSIVRERADPSATSIGEVVEAMLGNRPPERSTHLRAATAAPRTGGRIRMRGVSQRRALVDVDLDVDCGEIVGLAGLEGSGVGAVFDILFGVTRPEAGVVELPDGGGAPASIEQAVRRGIALVPADRKASGVMLSKSLTENVATVSGAALGQLGFLQRGRELHDRAEGWRVRMGIKAPSVRSRADELSGGNQQKVAFAKWLDATASVYLLDDPTRGVDIGAKHEVHAIIRERAAAGCAVVMASSDLDELVDVADRVVVFVRGRVAGIVEGALLTEHVLLEAINTGLVPATESRASLT
jgi:ABC-type sugar transport system ATPase subunit